MADLAESPPPSEPHFFQPLLLGFATKLSIPIAFYKEYLSKTGSKNRVELRSRRRPSKGRKVGMVRRRIVHGWREFCDEHELKVGYFLVFRYLGDLGFAVSVFDEKECEIEYQQQQVDEEEDVYLVEENDGMKSNENVTKVSKHHIEELKGIKNCIQMDVGSAESYVDTMWPAYLNCLRFPSSFCVANKLNKSCSEIIIKDNGGKVWHVKVRRCHSNKTVLTSTGWKSFVTENNLRKGDKFEFCIVSKGTTPLLSFRRISVKDLGEVPISSKRQKVVEVPKLDPRACKIECPEMDEHVDEEEAMVEQNDEEIMDVDRMRRQNNGQTGEEVPESACGQYAWKTCSSSAEPVTYFVKTSTQSALDRSKLFVSKNFVIANDLATKCGKIILQNSKGESWVATLKHENSDNCRVYITAGWTEFALANGLEAGRVFRLEIVEAETKLLTLKLTRRLTTS